VALVLIHNPCRSPSRRRRKSSERERDAGRERGRRREGNRGKKDRSQPLNIGVEHLDVAMSEITVGHVTGSRAQVACSWLLTNERFRDRKSFVVASGGLK